MCYETYDRLLRARALRRAADRPATPDREQPKPEADKIPAQPVTLAEPPRREKEPA